MGDHVVYVLWDMMSFSLHGVYVCVCRWIRMCFVISLLMPHDSAKSYWLHTACCE